jgi:uncharacterized membrane protein
VHIKNTYLQICVIVISIALVFIIQFIPDNVSRIIVGLPFVLLFPGFTLISVLFARKESLGGVERLALSFGLSLAVVPLIGLILNYTFGLTLYSILYSLAGFVWLFSVIAIIRQLLLPEAEKQSFTISFAWFSRQSILERILSIILVLVACGTIGVLVYTIAVPKTGSDYTEFYVLNEQGAADDYPSDISLGDTESVILFIINNENRTVDYTIEVLIDNDPNDDIEPVSLYSTDTITLENEEQYETLTPFTPLTTGDGQKIIFLLFKDGETESYLELNLTINVN